jgi:hypothetical protein
MSGTLGQKLKLESSARKPIEPFNGGRRNRAALIALFLRFQSEDAHEMDFCDGLRSGNLDGHSLPRLFSLKCLA